MADAPEEKPLIDIPGIDEAEKIRFEVHGRGADLQFKLFMDGKEIRVDHDNEWADRDWFGLVVRELDRRKVWKYMIEEKKNYHIFAWKKVGGK